MQKVTDILASNIDIADLPYIVQDISNLIGMPLALKLVEHYKNGNMWVPKHYGPDHVLCKIIGHEAAIKLINSYGGDHIEIPKCERALNIIRNTLIRQSDKSNYQIAKDFDLTPRHIFNIKKGFEIEEKQQSLF